MTRPRAPRTIAIAASLLAAGIFSSHALAQGQNPPVIKPVEVVATRIAEAPHDVSASIEVIGGEDLRARGARTMRDALSLAAGISIAPGGDAGPASAVPEIWGLREFDAFLLVIDDIPWGGALNPAVSSMSLRDVARIEILRGPAPVTFGATSFVGVIHIVHNEAAATSRYAEAHGGNFGSGGAGIDMPVATGSWKSRLSGDFDRQGFADDHTQITRGHALWRSAKTDGDKKTWGMADITILRQDPSSPHAREGAALSTATPLDANYNPDGAYINDGRFVGALGIQRPVMHGATWGAMASYTHSSQDMFRGFLTDISNSANNASGFKETIEINDVYADTHIIWPVKSHVQFMTGADLLFAQGEAKGATFNYTAPLVSSSQPSVTEPTTLDKDAENRRIFFGAYASADWKPVDHLSISAGVRLNATNERRAENSPSVSNTKLSGSVGAMYGLWEEGANHVRAFANYRNTFKPAAFDFGLAENEGILKPETSGSFEGGLKIRTMGGQLDIEASGFRMDFENLVTSTVVNNLPALQNAGSTRFQGFELATDLSLAQDVHARATYSAHDGKFVDFVQEFGGVNTQLAGKRFEMSAKTMFSAGLTLAPERGFIATVGMNYVGDRYLNKRNTALAPSYSTFDAGIGYRTPRAEFRLDGRNLGDKRDPVSESEFGDAQYYRMTARTILAGVVWKY